MPSGQQEFTYSEPSTKKVRRVFDFPSLKATPRGVFVIEFVGDGMVSRAVIKKGALIFVERCTVAGHLLTLVREDRKVCKHHADDKSSN